MSEWTSSGIVIEGQPIDVGGINPWSFQWIPLNEPPVELPHPAHPDQHHLFWLYEIDDPVKQMIFAVTEISPNVWGFYIATGGKHVN